MFSFETKNFKKHFVIKNYIPIYKTFMFSSAIYDHQKKISFLNFSTSTRTSKFFLIAFRAIKQ